MLDDAPDPEDQRRRLQRALAKIRVRDDCPVCARRTWKPYEYPVALVGAVEGTPGLMTIAMICDHCGFVRHHAATVLDRYVDPRD